MRLITALLAATLPILANGQAQLLPVGEFKARDGRPGPGKSWKLNDAAGQALAAQVNAIAAQTPVVIDYEHQTLKMDKNGQPAPAAGWIKSVTWLDGKGLFSEVDWTERARAAIAANEYRYISPVITFDEDTGAVNGLHLAALTNFPALLGMDAVVAALNTQLPTQEPRMATLLAALIASLGLPATTTEAECTAAVTALKAQADAAKTKTPLSAALTTALGISATADETAVLSAIDTIKKAGGGANPAAVELVTKLTTQVAELTARLDGDKVISAVDAAIAAKKLVPAQRDTYIDMGKKDMAMLTAVLAAAPVIPGLDGQAAHLQAEGNGTGTAALTATQSLIAKSLGVDPAKYAESLKQQA
jgi:phage I-like protein